MNTIHIAIEGTEELAVALRKYPDELARYLAQAAEEVGVEVYDSPGLSQYPPLTAANLPPVPYYVRGRGTQVSAAKNLHNSERYGTQFYARAERADIIVGNRASYAQYLTDDEFQAAAMAAIGWRKLIDVANEKIAAVTEIYQGWADKLIEDLDLD
jgi:hypothetical protein